MSSTPPSFSAALLTPRGRGAVAVIRLSGDHSALDRINPPYFRAANGRPIGAQPLGRIVFGQWGRDAVEDIVLCRIDESTLELCCHGGDRAVDRILNDCRESGAAIVTWSEQLALTADRLEAELQTCLSRAVTWRTAEHLLSQTDGRLRTACERLARITWTDADRRCAWQSLAEPLRWANFGVHLSQPWRVVLTGKPNVGKSSLINALLGYDRSLVFDQPGTTRDVVTAQTAFDGWPVQLTDTAGLRSAAESLEAEGIARARQQLAEADLIIELIDISAATDPPPSHAVTSDSSFPSPRPRPGGEGQGEGARDHDGEIGNHHSLSPAASVTTPSSAFGTFSPEAVQKGPHSAPFGDMLGGSAPNDLQPRTILVAHKCDLPDQTGGLLPKTALRVSSVTGEGLEELQREIVCRLVPDVPDPDTPLPLTPRQVALLQMMRLALSAGDEAAYRVAAAAILAGPA